MSKLAYVFRDMAELELHFMSRVVGVGDTVVDVGAHYGDYTVSLAKLVGSGGSVVAVEPMAHACSVLAENVALNGLTNTIVERVALGSQPGTLQLHHHADPSRSSLGAFEDDSGSEPVTVERLDDLVDRLGLPSIDFIKLDIEGAEVDALQGSRRTIERDHPTVLFEYVPAAADRLGHDAGSAWDFLASMGYSFALMMNDGDLRSVDRPEGPGPNYFAVHSSRRSHEDLGSRGARQVDGTTTAP